MLFILCSMIGFSQINAQDTTGVYLKMEDSGPVSMIVGYYETPSNEEEELRYKLISTKIGQSGRSSTSQSGRFTSKPGEAVKLSQLGVNIGSGDRYEITLEIYKADELIDETTISRPENDE